MTDMGLWLMDEEMNDDGHVSGMVSRVLVGLCGAPLTVWKELNCAEAEEDWVGAVDESCLPVKMGQWYQNVLVVKNMDGIVIIFSANIYQYFTQLYIYSYLFNSMGWDGIYIFFSDAKIDILCKQ